MPIRTEYDYRAARARLNEQTVIMRSRSFTDDEQHDFDALTRDLAAYSGDRAPEIEADPAAVPAAPAPTASQPYGTQHRDLGALARVGGINLLATAPTAAHAPAPFDLVADMKRRHGIAA